MPDDSPFPPSVNDASEPGDEGTPTRDAASQMAEIIAAATGPALAEQRAAMGMLQQQLHQTQAQLAAQQQAAAARPAPAPLAPGVDPDQAWLNEFVAKPTEKLNAYIDEKFQQLARQHIAPPLAGIAQTVAAQTLREQASRVEARFGAGTYTEVIAPHLERILGGMPENMRLQPDTVKRTVDALLGSDELADELGKRASAKAKAENEANRRRPPSPMGSPGRQPGGLDLDINDEDRAFQTALRDAGFEFGDEDLKLSKQVSEAVRGSKDQSLDAMLDARDKIRPLKRKVA